MKIPLTQPKKKDPFLGLFSLAGLMDVKITDFDVDEVKQAMDDSEASDESR